MKFNLLDIIPVFISLLPILIIILFILLIIVCIKNKVRIKLRTFKGKGFRPKRGPWGTYVYNGHQGKGKTYSIIEYLVDNNGKIQTFSNITNIRNVDNITYFTGFKEMIEIKDKLDMMEYFKRDFIIFNGKRLNIDKTKQLVFVYDELFVELGRGSKLGQSIIDFLCQMRKRQIICLTTCQVWSQLPLDWRQLCRYQIDCNMFPFFKTGFLIKTFKDAEVMKWSNEEQEHVAPIVETTITKCRKRISESFDTRLRISSTIYKNEYDYLEESATPQE